MTPKEKAEELVNKYITNQNFWYLKNLVDGLRISQARKCAIIAVDEIIDLLCHDINPLFNYWFEVKKEIEKL